MAANPAPSASAAAPIPPKAWSVCLPQQMAEAEQCMATGDCHCGQARGSAATRVIPIVPQPAPAAGSRPDHCARAGFATVVSVPVQLQDRMVGEIDLFYRSAVDLCGAA